MLLCLVIMLSNIRISDVRYLIIILLDIICLVLDYSSAVLLLSSSSIKFICFKKSAESSK